MLFSAVSFFAVWCAITSVVAVALVKRDVSELVLKSDSPEFALTSSRLSNTYLPAKQDHQIQYSNQGPDIRTASINNPANEAYDAPSKESSRYENQSELLVNRNGQEKLGTTGDGVVFANRVSDEILRTPNQVDSNRESSQYNGQVGLSQNYLPSFTNRFSSKSTSKPIKLSVYPQDTGSSIVSPNPTYSNQEVPTFNSPPKTQNHQTAPSPINSDYRLRSPSFSNSAALETYNRQTFASNTPPIANSPSSAQNYYAKPSAYYGSPSLQPQLPNNPTYIEQPINSFTKLQYQSVQFKPSPTEQNAKLTANNAYNYRAPSHNVPSGLSKLQQQPDTYSFGVNNKQETEIVSDNGYDAATQLLKNPRFGVLIKGIENPNGFAELGFTSADNSFPIRPTFLKSSSIPDDSYRQNGVGEGAVNSNQKTQVYQNQYSNGFDSSSPASLPASSRPQFSAAFINARSGTGESNIPVVSDGPLRSFSTSVNGYNYQSPLNDFGVVVEASGNQDLNYRSRSETPVQHNQNVNSLSSSSLQTASFGGTNTSPIEVPKGQDYFNGQRTGVASAFESNTLKSTFVSSEAQQQQLNGVGGRVETAGNGAVSNFPVQPAQIGYANAGGLQNRNSNTENISPSFEAGMISQRVSSYQDVQPVSVALRGFSNGHRQAGSSQNYDTSGGYVY